MNFERNLMINNLKKGQINTYTQNASMSVREQKSKRVDNWNERMWNGMAENTTTEKEIHIKTNQQTHRR